MQHRPGDLRRVADAAQRVHRLQVRQLLGAEGVQHGCAHRAGTDGVHADSLGGMVERHAAHQTDHGVLGDVVGHLSLLADDARGRGDADDGSASRAGHGGHGVARAQVRALEVDRHDPVPLLLGHLADGAGAGNPGVVHEHVQAAEPLHGGLRQALGVRGGGDVGLQPQPLAARLDDAPRRCVGGCAVHVGRDHPGALAGEQCGDLGPEAPACAGHDGSLALQSSQRGLPSRRRDRASAR